ncbi:hypothetical protein ACTPEM_25295, partial [Clostridioides difficile]
DGIKYDELSDEEKEEYENTFNDDESIGDEIGNNAVNEWLFNSGRFLIIFKLFHKGGINMETRYEEANKITIQSILWNVVLTIIKV